MNIDATVKFVIYADDSSILISGPDVNTLAIKCNEILDKLSIWSQINRININPNKTKVMIFRAKNKPIQLHHTFQYAGNKICITHEHKILGIHFTSHLNWDSHVGTICKKLAQVTGVLSRCRRLLPMKAKLQIYHALFLSHINYCSLVWATTSKMNINKIFMFQKKIVRHIANLEYFASTDTAFRDLSLVKAEHMYRFRILRAFYLGSNSFKSFLTATASLQTRTNTLCTRNSDVWFVPKFRNNYKLQSLQHNLPCILNEYKHVINYNLKDLRKYFCEL